MADRADRWDGAEFLGIDNEGAGNGNTSTYSLDTLLEHAVANNVSHTWKEGWKCTWSPRESSEGIRKLASAARSCIAIVEIPTTPVPETIEINFDAKVTDDGGSGNASVDVYAVLEGGRQTSQVEDITIADTGATQPFQPQSITITVDDAFANNDYAFLYIEISCQVLQGTAATGLTWTSNTPEDSTGQLSSSTNVGPATVMVDQQDTNLNHPVEFLALDDGAVDGTQTTLIYTPGNDQESTVTDGTYDIHYLSYMQTHGFEVSLTFADEDNELYSPSLSSQMRARQPVRGVDVARHAANVDEIYGRARLNAWGVQGDRRGNATTWGGLAQRWQMIRGDNAGSLTDVMKDDMRLDASDGDIMVRLLWLPVHVQDLFYGASNPRQQRADASWTIKSIIEVPEDADSTWSWSEATEVTSDTVSLQFHHFSAQRRFRSPTLRALQFAHFGDWSGSEEYRYFFKEGQLYRDGGAINAWDEMGWIQSTLTFDMSVSGLGGADIANGMRFRVQARLDSVDKYRADRQVIGSDDASTDRIYLILVAAHVYQRGGK